MSEKKRLKVYRVVLTEKYEVLVAASSKAKAKDAVGHFGGKEPFYRSETVYSTNEPFENAEFIEGENDRSLERF